jgi:hypothetical protein
MLFKKKPSPTVSQTPSKQMIEAVKRPPKGPKLVVPTIFQRCLAGVELRHKPGRGQERLDRLCARHGLTWAIVEVLDRTHTYGPSSPKILGTVVLIGELYEGQAEVLKGWGSDDYHPHDHVDASMNSIAEYLESEYGEDGDEG